MECCKFLGVELSPVFLNDRMYKYKSLSNQPKTSAFYNLIEGIVPCLSKNSCSFCAHAYVFLFFSGYKFIVVTTAITNSSRLLEALLDNRI